MDKLSPTKIKNLPSKCILDEEKLCDNCCDCFVCDLDPTKSCDNCAKCLELADYNAIEITELLYNKNIFKHRKNIKKKSSFSVNSTDTENPDNEENHKK